MTTTDRNGGRSRRGPLKGADAPWGSTPPPGTHVDRVTIVVTRSGRGYTGSASLIWVPNAQRPATYPPITSCRQETVFRQDWPFAPSVGAVLRALSRYAWDMSISPQVQELEGQEALPGL